VVAGVDPANDAWAFGPPPSPVADDELVLVDWKESPLKVKPGDAVTLTYFKPEVEGRVEEATQAFKLRAVIPLEGPAADPDLVPTFPGITDKLSLRDWDPPFPYNNTRMKPRDERYWQKYRTRPKAYIPLATARRLWGTRFGDTTSVRVIPKNGDPTVILPAYRESLLKHVDPKRGGFAFDDVAERLHAAGQGSTDFGMLFLSFSFFLIAAALMLVGLLFRLSLERRAREIGLLRAAGYPLKSVRRLLLLEGLIVAVAGSLVGLVAALGYAAGMLYLLAKLWPTPGVGSFLTLHVSPTSLAIGFVASVLMSELAVWWAVRGLSRIEPAALLKGVGVDESANLKPARWGKWVAIGCLVGAIALMAMAPTMPPGEPQAGTFFGGGMLLLGAGLAAVWIWLKRPRRAVVHSLTPLGVRNATRNPTRSLLTAGLLASAAFLLVAVESFRREPDRDFAAKTGGSGGFPLVGQTDTPVFQDLTGDATLNDIERNVQKAYQAAGKPSADVDARMDEVRRVFQSVTVYPIRVKAGDDASCLNLYQATRPRVLGVTDALVDRGGFQFSDTLAKTPEEKANPWLLLRQSGDAVPAFVETNTAVWQLKKGLGDEIEVPDEEGRTVKMRIVGLLQDSVFQSELVVGDVAFRKSFPRTEGFSEFLIEPAEGVDSKLVQKTFDETLATYGMDVTPTADRVAAYLAVQNTYLTTFQLLGGFGLLLGVLGLAVVLLRNVWERRPELALLRAMGYRLATLNRVVFTENAMLLLLGLGAGVFAALVAVAPHVAGGESVPWGRLGIMLGAVLVVGLIAAGAAVTASVRTPIVQGLRRE
jgi:ABC-type antimicrobial peptide transport system permease subunit